MNLNFFSVAGLTLSITCFLLTFIIIVFGKSVLHRTWALFNITVGLWGVGAFFIGKINDETVALIAWRIIHIAIAFIPIFMFHVVYELCNLKYKKLLYFIYIQGIIFSILSITSKLFIPNVRFVFNSFYYDVSGPLFYPFFAIWGFIVGFTHFKLFTTYLGSSGRLRNQILYLLAGSGLGFSGGITNFLPAIGIDFYPFGNFTIPIYCLIATYAILRYRLLDITIAITRTGVFVVTYSLVLGIPLILANVFRKYLVSFLGENWWYVPMGLLIVFATVGPFIYIYLNKKAEDRLLREQKRYQHTLRQASGGMTRIRDLKRLLNLIVHVVTKAVKIEFASIFLLDSENSNYRLLAIRDSANVHPSLSLEKDSSIVEHLYAKREPIVYEEIQLHAQDMPNDLKINTLEKQLKEINAAVVVPSFVSNRLLGFIVLGRKLSGKTYSQDDLNVFSVLANQAALAIENAQFYDDIKKTQEQLFQTEKMATIGTMADGLSHQVNNRFQALSLIAGDSLDILQTTDISGCSLEIKETCDQMKHAFERIQANVMQGGEIVRGLLRYSRPTQDGFQFEDFNYVLNGALEMAQYKVRLQELDIQREIPQNLPKLKCNLVQLQEVFFNLLDNAYDAIKERKMLNKDLELKGRIKIAVSPINNHLRIVFEDNGIGVRDKDKEKLFTPFFTTKATIKKGTGLGLYVIQKIITFHEGTISIDSKYNAGTRFEITLPMSK